MNDFALLSLIIFTPAIGAFFISLCNSRNESGMRTIANAAALVTLLLTLVPWMSGRFDRTDPNIQMGVKEIWIGTWNVYYQLGLDGISYPLVLLTSLISFLALLASGNITKAVKGYLILFLLLETGMLGVFIALDFFLFYVFWEV